MKELSVISAKKIGYTDSVDLEMESGYHNFFANNIVVSNSHALATAGISALTVYLKYKYPLNWYLECLNVGVKQEDVGQIAHELKEFGIKLLPPDLVKSEINYSIDGMDIRYGLSSIKGLKKKEPLVEFCKYKFNFKNKLDCFDAARTSKINIGALSALIQAGALSSYKGSRSRLVLEAQTYNLLKDREKSHLHNLFEAGETDILSGIKKMAETKTDDGKMMLTEKRFAKVKSDYEKYKQIYLLNSRNEDLANWVYEFSLLGNPYSQSLKQIYHPQNPTFCSIGEALKKKANTPVMFAGIVLETPIKKKSAKGSNYIMFNVTDESGVIKSMVFNGYSDNIERIMEQNGGKLPEKGDLVVIRGKVKEKAIFIDDLGIQSDKIYMKLQELKDSE